jgi:hypothetical protein
VSEGAGDLPAPFRCAAKPKQEERRTGGFFFFSSLRNLVAGARSFLIKGFPHAAERSGEVI